MVLKAKVKSEAEKLAALPNEELVNRLLRAAQEYGSCGYVIDPLEGSFRRDAQKYAQEVLRRLAEKKKDNDKQS